MKFSRHFTKPNLSIADQIEWKTVSSEILTSDGTRIFYMPEVEVPNHWTQGPINILAQKYFRKAGISTRTQRIEEDNIPKWLWCSEPFDDYTDDLTGESSAKQVFHRLAGAWTYWGWKEGIFNTQSPFGKDVNNELAEENARIFYDEIYYMLAMQFAAPNSPQWFNTGLNWTYGITGDKSGQWAVDINGQPYETQDSYTNPQVHACYIQPISDNLVESGGIFDLLRKEAIIFKHGSGTGTNFSNLRSKYETLSGGGKSSGMMSFLKIFDAAAGAIQSGGTTRRAAKMVCLDLDHPEIEEFIEWKMKEEAKAAALYVGSQIIFNQASEPTSVHYNDIPQAMKDRALNGIEIEICDLDFEGIAMSTVDGQNANDSIRITNEFLTKVDLCDNWPLIARTTGKIVKVLKSEELWQKICTAAWACADPGLQFHDTINLWHTCKNDGTINASNPCSEYMFLDDTACNLASLNLGKFLLPDHSFNIKSFTHATRIWTTVLEISVYMASFPSKEIAHNSYLYRTLGLGYCNAGGILMCQGIGYDSDKGRDYIASITALMHGVAYRTSAEMASELGPFSRWEANSDSMVKVLQMHKDAVREIHCEGETGKIVVEAIKIWEPLGGGCAFRNAQVTLIAPTGTIALLMDSGDFTGIEPGFSLVQYKQLAGGGGMKIVNNCVPEGLRSLGYTAAQIMSISQHITTHDTIEGWTRNGEPMPEEHLSVFDCAVPGGETGTRSLRPMAHVLMVAAIQPFLSGAVSKTVNLPNDATIADVDHVYRESHRLGLKAVALYRDDSKLAQPLNSRQAKIEIYPSFKKELLNATYGEDGIIQITSGTQTSDLTPSFTDEDEDNRDVFNQTEAILNKSFESLLNHTPDTTLLTRSQRHRLPSRTTGYRQKYSVDGQSIYLHTGEYEDGQLGEIFVEFSREGSLVRALTNSIGKVVSIGLQYGVPLSEFVDAFVFTKFEPSGIVHGHDMIKLCTSPLDLIFKDLAIHYLNQMEFANTTTPEPNTHIPAPESNINQDIETRSGAEEESYEFHNLTITEMKYKPGSGSESSPLDKFEIEVQQPVFATPKPLTTIRLKHGDACQQCGHYPTIRTGTCITCPNCGANSGCG